jgi:signal transduction histidine kinase/CheY-like chemotaxis protein
VGTSPVCTFSDRLSAIGGETGRMIANHDWSASPIGAPESWPQSLRSVVGLQLSSKFPMFVAWGPELTFLYNDAYAEILGSKHPQAFGARFFDVWAEIWPDIAPLIDAALAGQASYHEDLPLVVRRRGYDERAWFTFSYSPVLDESGRPAGMLATVSETTAKVLAEQRQNFLVSLGDALAQYNDPVALTAAASELLGRQLGAGRSGYGEIDASGEVVSVAQDWTDGSMFSLAGKARVLEAFGPEVIAELRAGHTLVVSDCLTDSRTCLPDHLVTWESIGTRALVVAPLVSEGRLVAILYVHSSAPRAWSELDVHLVEDLGARTWAAVERVRAETALRESEAALAAEVEGMERLQEISTLLVGDETPQAIYDAILTAACDLMGSEWASIQMLDAAGDLRLLAHRGYDPRSAAYWQTVDASSRSTCGIALTTGERVIEPDVENSGLPADSGDLQSYRWTGMRSLQTTPLLSRSGKPLGMLSTHWKRPHTPSARDLKFFDVLSRQAADAIDRTMAQAELRESEARQAFLLSLSDELRSLKSSTDIASIAAQRLGERFGLSRVFYAEYFGTVMRVERDYTNGVESIAGEHDLEAFGPDLLNAYRECPIVKVDDVRTDPRFNDLARSGLEARQVSAYFDVVLFEEGHWVSLLALQSATPRTWSPSEGALFREVGERVKVAIERARAEDQLRELNETLEAQVAERTDALRRYHDIVDATVAPICAFDTDYRLIAFNRAHNAEFRRVNGFDTKIGDVFPDLFIPEQAARMRTLMGRALSGESFTVAEEFGRPELGTPCWEITYTPLLDDRGQVVGAFHHAVDIAERLVAQVELEAAQEALRQSQKMEAMGQLTGGVAHDFNNLLTPIVGSLDMLQHKKLGGEREQRLIAGAMQSAERAKTLVQRLLAFARRQPLQPVPVDLAKLVTGMGELIASTTGPQIRVLVDASEDLPPAKADPNQLEMALLNLAVNARDAMADGGGTLRISTRVEDVRKGHHAGLRPGKYLCLSVADTGGGMDEATIARAIEPFFSTKGVGKGTGLGLSMVHGLANQLGGDLAIQSRPGLGTNVELWLPCSDMPQQTADHPTVQSVLIPEIRGTALLVDDEELVRMSTADMLSDLGYAVVEASSGEEALRLLQVGKRFDLLVTDHLMPGLSGTELAREVRATTPEIPILLVSGYAEADDVDADLPRLAKPFRKNELKLSLAQLSSNP